MGTLIQVRKVYIILCRETLLNFAKLPSIAYLPIPPPTTTPDEASLNLAVDEPCPTILEEDEEECIMVPDQVSCCRNLL